MIDKRNENMVLDNGVSKRYVGVKNAGNNMLGSNDAMQSL